MSSLSQNSRAAKTELGALVKTKTHAHATDEDEDEDGDGDENKAGSVRLLSFNICM